MKREQIGNPDLAVGPERTIARAVSRMKNIQVSVVVPMYNESGNINTLFSRLEAVLADVTEEYEIVCINDGSSDETLEMLLEYNIRNPRIVVLDLARNFGKEIALTAGLDFARGEAIIPIDADLQDPPELIADFVKKWREGYEVVYAQRRSRKGETFVKLTSANLFYRLINRMTDIRIPENTGDFRLLDRKVVDAIRMMPERNRFMKGLFSWVGFRQVAVEYDRDPRLSGKSKWNYIKLWRLALDGITSFSSMPLKVWSYLGGGIALISFLYMLALFLRTIIAGVDVPGYTSIMVVVLFLGGIQLFGIGILGEYIGRIFDEVKHRPMYVLRAKHGFGEEDTG